MWRKYLGRSTALIKARKFRTLTMEKARGLRMGGDAKSVATRMSVNLFDPQQMTERRACVGPFCYIGSSKPTPAAHFDIPTLSLPYSSSSPRLQLQVCTLSRRSESKTYRESWLAKASFFFLFSESSYLCSYAQILRGVLSFWLQEVREGGLAWWCWATLGGAPVCSIMLFRLPGR